MHTTQLGDNIVAHHNGDFSGDVIFSGQFSVEDDIGGATVTIPFSCIETLVAEHIRSERISELEQMTTPDLLYGRDFG